MRALAAAAALALALPTLAAAQPPRPGSQLYAGNCARCHGSGGEGIVSSPEPGDAGPSLRGVGALSADFYLRTGYMPLDRAGEQPRRNTPTFSPRELDALVAYVASLGPGPKVPRPHPERGDVAEGSTLFTENCAGCHQIAVRGGYLPGAVAPSLTEATPTQIAEAVRVGPYLMPRFSRRAIDDRQLDSIVAYVEYARDPQDAGGWAIGRLGPIPEGVVAWLLAGTVLVACCVAIGSRVRR